MWCDVVSRHVTVKSFDVIWLFVSTCLIVATHETSFTVRGATYEMQNTMELRHSCLIAATYEQAFTVRGATYEMQSTMELWHSCLIVAKHTKRRLPCAEQPTGCKTQWNYDIHVWQSQRMPCHLHKAEQQESPSNITKYCACHEKWDSKIWEKTADASLTLGVPVSPSMMRAWTCQSATRPTTQVTFRNGRGVHFVLKIQYFARRSKFHLILPLPPKVTVELHQILYQPRKLMCNLNATSPNIVLAKKVTVELHQPLRMPRKVTVEFSWTAPHIVPTTTTECALNAASANITLSTKSVLFFDANSLLLYYSLILLFFYFAMSFVYRKFLD